LGLMAVMVGGCRRESGRNMGQSGTEPSANIPSAPEAPRAGEPKSQPRAIGGGPAGHVPKTTAAAAVAGIAAAQCDRQVRCNNVGPNETYKTRGECISKMQSDKSEGINAKSCPGGINEANLNRCLEALRNEGCGSPVGSLERLEACKTDGMCLK
jgi:Family of unknown function (DUF6184)